MEKYLKNLKYNNYINSHIFIKIIFLCFISITINFMNSHKIFSSLWTLNYADKESDYIIQRNISKNYKRKNIIITTCLLTFSILYNIIQPIFFTPKGPKAFAFHVLTISGYVVTSLYIVNLLLALFLKKFSLHKLIDFLNYYLLTFTFMFYRFNIANFSNIDLIVFYMIYTAENLIRLIWFFTGMMEFNEGVIIHILIIISVWCFFLPLSGSFSTAIRLIGQNVIMIITSLISYFYTYERKKSMYYNLKLGKQSEWYRNIINKMSSGYAHIKNGKIESINDILVEKLIKNKKISELIDRNVQSSSLLKNLKKRVQKSRKLFTVENDLNILNNKSKIETNSEELFEEIFKNSTCLIPRKANSHLEEFYSIGADLNDNHRLSLKNISDFYLERKMEKIGNDEIGSNYVSSDLSNFILIGTTTIEVNNRMTESDPSVIYLEIYGRYSWTDKEENLELIFNDVTRTKLVSEFKYKTLLLSKVAHEFKNPLLCIIELVDQIDDIISKGERENDEEEMIAFKNLSKSKIHSYNKSIQEILPQIKSLSNYLMILIKDFDYFSLKNTQKKASLEFLDVDLDSLLEFCVSLTKGLLKRFKKEDRVKVLIINDTNIKSIKVDEVKLKQILINLLSNSVKYTNSGSIKLSLELINEKLKFSVCDTGKGISEIQQKSLFEPFNTSFELDEANKYSSGLGLPVIKDLVELFGSKIKFTSIVNSGSEFWFSIDCEKVFYDNFENDSKLDVLKSYNRDQSISLISLEEKESINLNKFDETDTKSEITFKKDFNPASNIIKKTKDINKMETGLIMKSANSIDIDRMNIKLTVKKNFWRKRKILPNLIF